MDLGAFLRSRRTDAGLSLRALAADIGIDPAYLSRVERNLVPPSEALLGRAVDALGLSETQVSVLAGKLPARWMAAIEEAPREAIAMVDQALSAVDPSLSGTGSRTAVSTAGTRVIECDDFPFEYLSRVAEAESWRKEINRPTYHLHKWWAQRLGSVFRGIVLGAFSPRGSNLMEMFYQPSCVPGAVVFDPFMGSGTTLGETLKLGGRAIGRDINPVSYNAVRNALRPHSLDVVRHEFRGALEDVRAEMSTFYQGMLRGSKQEVQYYFWVRGLPCPNCLALVDLFRTYVFSKHAYAKRHPAAKVLCPSCGGVNSRRYDVAETECDSCGHRFDASAGPARGSKAECGACGEIFRIAARARELGGPPPARLYAKIMMDNGSREYRGIDEVDVQAYQAAKTRLAKSMDLFPQVRIQPGYNTNQVLSNGFEYWHQMFNDRQLLVLGTLGRRLTKIGDDSTRELLLCAFSGLLEFNNMFTSFKGEGTGAVRHMFSHHVLKPERSPFEANPLAARGSGNFEGIFQRRVERLIKYAADPFELVPVAKGSRQSSEKRGGLSVGLGAEPSASYRDFERGGRLYLSVGDSANTDLPDESVDAVVTDPPFFDNVHYSELADFFWVWQRHLIHEGRTSESTRSSEEVQHGDRDEFAARLGRVFRECRRVLAPQGLFVFTYHHSRSEGWLSLLSALHEGDWGVVACHPVKSELSVASPKAQAKSPIDLDVIVVCRKREQRSSERPPREGEALLELSVARAQAQVERFNRVGRSLSRNDVLVVVSAQILRNLSWDPDYDVAMHAMGAVEEMVRESAMSLFEEQVIEQPVFDSEQRTLV